MNSVRIVLGYGISWRWPRRLESGCAPELAAMPELPEVETMVRGLRPALVGRTLRDVVVHDAFLLQGCSAEEFQGWARGARVERVDRRGKWVVIALAGHRGIIVIQ